MTTPQPTTRAVSRKTVALVLLCLQNASVSILTRLSRTAHGPNLYNPSAAVFTAEILKGSLSLAALAYQRHGLVRSKGKPSTVLGQAGAAIRDLLKNQRREQLLLAVPAALYSLQNTLLYVALSNLDAATYQTTYQLKLLTTAIFSILFFRHPLSAAKWFSLILLTLGVAIVQLDSTDASGKKAASQRDLSPQDPRKGFAAILAACISSGLAGAWFEWVLKRPNGGGPDTSRRKDRNPSTPAESAPPSLWARNLQLSVPSLVFSFVGVLLSSPLRLAYESHGARGLFHGLACLCDGFTPLVWAVVLNQALGGLLVAMVVREADSVSKGFATSIAIVRKSVSTLASAALYGIIPGTMFMVGSGLVISSTVLYSFDRS
ncbi:hypothetical protein BMF94_6359 [Rhodotorula taiwanensis]|uniref:UDP-galactose transporter n=1 Tax=Rhodotorula taiwanensis TaxID=741276 RepID=A0A2S5B1K0_9BASI|nr:hypothetical protein BMF94_6359 [Rhodotorula taiwanensis]